MKTVAVISDMHVGSQCALCPESVEIVDSLRGTTLITIPSASQRLLLDCWKQMVADTEGQLDLVIVNGDTCDGMNLAEGGAHTITNDMYAQAEMASELLAMIDCDNFLLTVGSGYHSRNGRNGNAVEGYLAKALARRISERGGTPNVKFVPEAILEFGGKRFHVSHTVGTSSTQQYRATALMRDMTNMKLNGDDYKFGPIDMVIRGHTHFFIHVDLSDIQGLITPAWKFRDSFCTKIGINTQPDFGYALLTWDEGLGTDIRVSKQLFRLPGTACAVVDFGV